MASTEERRGQRSNERERRTFSNLSSAAIEKERKEQEERLREEFEKEHLKNVLINSMKRRKYAEQARRQGKRVVIYCEECFIRKAKQKNDKDFWVCDECLAGEK